MNGGILAAAMGGVGAGVIAVALVMLVRGLRRLLTHEPETHKEARIALANDAGLEDNPYRGRNAKEAAAWEAGWRKAKRARDKVASSVERPK